MSSKHLAILISFFLFLVTLSSVLGQEEAPSVNIVSPVGEQTGPEVQIDYELIDPDGDPVSVVVEYSVDGGEFRPCTPSASGEGTDDLSTSSTGEDHTFVWDSKTDLGGMDAENVTIRITPYKGAITGTPAVTDYFSVSNEDIPVDDDTMPLSDMIGSGKVIDDYVSRGSASGLVADLTITSNSDEPVDFSIDPSGLEGQVLVNPNDAEQDLVIADIPGMYSSPSGGGTFNVVSMITLDPGESVLIPVIGYCINYNLKNPSDDMDLTLNPTSDKTDIDLVRNILEALANTTFPENMTKQKINHLTQVVIWAGQPENRNETASGFSERGYILDEDDMPILKDILNNSGVDTTEVGLFSSSKEDPPEEDTGDDDLLIMLLVGIAISIAVMVGLFVIKNFVRKIRKHKGKRKHKKT